MDGSEAACAGSIALDGENRPFQLPRAGQLTYLTNINCQGRHGVGLRWTPLAGQVRGPIKIVDCPYRPQC